MGITSGQITEKLLRSSDPRVGKQKLFESARYFVCQVPAAEDFSETIDGYYRGRKVIPGPRANKELSPVLDVRDVRLLESQHFIRFVDNLTTDGADDSVKQALFTLMDDSEANEYEKVLRELQGGTIK